MSAAHDRPYLALAPKSSRDQWEKGRRGAEFSTAARTAASAASRRVTSSLTFSRSFDRPRIWDKGLPFDGATIVEEAAARTIVGERREPRNRVGAFTR